MKIATLNINNINKHFEPLSMCLKAARPDIVCLQELKCEDKNFPADALKRLGYHGVWRGQRSWNGVAILTRGFAPVLVRDSLPGDPKDIHARYLEAAVNGVLVACLYLPNGNPQPGPKFEYKLAWLERFIKQAARIKKAAVPAVLVGDFNVVSTEFDIYPNHSTPCCSRRVGRPLRGCCDRAGSTPYASSTPMIQSFRSGAICETDGHATQAFVSTSFS